MQHINVKECNGFEEVLVEAFRLPLRVIVDALWFGCQNFKNGKNGPMYSRVNFNSKFLQISIGPEILEAIQ